MMNTNDRTNLPPRELVLPHFSLRGIIGGAIISLAALITLLVAGTSLGLGVLDFENGISMTATSWSVGIWLILSFLISLFVGAYVAGRTSENLSSFAGALNGVVIWGLMTILSFNTISKGLTKSISATGNIVETVGSKIGIPAVEDLNVSKILSKIQNSIDGIEEKIEEIEAPEIKGLAKDEYEDLKSEFINLAKSSLLNPSQVQDNVSQMKEKVRESVEKFNAVLDREKIRSIVAQNSELTEEQVEETTDKWLKTVQSVATNVDAQAEKLVSTTTSYLENLQNEAVDVADEVKNKIALAMLIFTVMLLAGLAVSIFGGTYGVKSALTGRF